MSVRMTVKIFFGLSLLIFGPFLSHMCQAQNIQIKEIKQITDASDDNALGIFSKDGKGIYFINITIQNEEPKSFLYRYDIESGEKEKICATEGANPKSG